MTEYAMIEISNQQAFTDAPHMALTPRIESRGDRTYTNLNDLQAVVTTNVSPTEITFEARGRLLSSTHKPLPEGEVRYQLTYRLTNSAAEILATATGATKNPIVLIVPVVSRSTETVAQKSGAIKVTKPGGIVNVTINAKQDFATLPEERTFNLVPGFECVPLSVTLQPGEEVRVRIEAIVA